MQKPRRRDPLRPADWRWRSALHLADCGLRASSPCTGDEWTRAGLRFVMALRRCQDAAEHSRLAQDMPDIAVAWEIHTAEPAMPRWIIEARILAAEPEDVIATKTGQTAEAIRCYEQLFFDVRPSLRVCDYITNIVIGPRLQMLSEGDVDVLLKLVGYRCGGVMLDAWIHYYERSSRPPAIIDGLDTEQLKELELMLSIRAAIQALTLPASSITPSQLDVFHETILRPSENSQSQTSPLKPVQVVCDCEQLRPLVPEPVLDAA